MPHPVAIAFVCCRRWEKRDENSQKQEIGPLLLPIIQGVYGNSWFIGTCCVVIAGAFVLLCCFHRQMISHLCRMFRSMRRMEQERVSSEHYDSLLQGMDGILMLFEAIAYEMPQGSQLRSEMEKALDHAEEYLAQEREGMYKFQSSAQTADNFLLEFIAAGDELVRNSMVQLEIVMEGAPRRLQRIAREEICGVGREAIAGAFLRAGTRHV